MLWKRMKCFLPNFSEDEQNSFPILLKKCEYVSLKKGSVSFRMEHRSYGLHTALAGYPTSRTLFHDVRDDFAVGRWSYNVYLSTHLSVCMFVCLLLPPHLASSILTCQEHRSLLFCWQTHMYRYNIIRTYVTYMTPCLSTKSACAYNSYDQKFRLLYKSIEYYIYLHLPSYPFVKRYICLIQGWGILFSKHIHKTSRKKSIFEKYVSYKSSRNFNKQLKWRHNIFICSRVEGNIPLDLFYFFNSKLLFLLQILVLHKKINNFYLKHYILELYCLILDIFLF